MPEIVVAFVDAEEPTDCYVVPIKFTGGMEKPDEYVDAYRRAVIRWRDEDLSGKLPESYFNPTDLLDWRNDPALIAQLAKEGITAVEPGLTPVNNAWNFTEVLVRDRTELASIGV